MHILDHNPPIWVVILNGVQGNADAAVEEQLLKIQLSAQACDIRFNALCPKEFNKISYLENAKEIWDTLIEIHGGTTEYVKETKLDIINGQLDKLKMKDGEKCHRDVFKIFTHHQ